MVPSTNNPGSLQPFSNFSHNTTNIVPSVTGNNATSNSTNSSVSLNSQAYQQLLLAINQNPQVSGISNNNSSSTVASNNNNNTNENSNFNLLPQQNPLFQQQPQSMFPQALLQSSQQQSLSQFLAQSPGINQPLTSNLQQQQIPQFEGFCPSSQSAQFSGCLPPQLFNSLSNPYQIPLLPPNSNATSGVDMLQLFQMSLQLQQILQQQQLQNQQFSQQFNIHPSHQQLSQEQSIPQLLLNASFPTNLGSQNPSLPFDENTLLLLKNSLIPTNLELSLPFQGNNDLINGNNSLRKSTQHQQQQQSQNFGSSCFPSASMETQSLHTKLLQLGITNDPIQAKIDPKQETFTHPETKLENLTNIQGNLSLKTTIQPHLLSQQLEADQQSNFYPNSLLNSSKSSGLIGGGGSEKTIILSNNKQFTQSQQCLEQKREEIDKHEDKGISKNKENTSQNYGNEDGKINQSYQSHNNSNNNTASQMSNYERKTSKKSNEESEYDYDDDQKGQEESEWDEENDSRILKKRKKNYPGFQNRFEKQTQLKTKEECSDIKCSSEGRIRNKDEYQSSQLGGIKGQTDSEDCQNSQREVSSLTQSELHQQCNMLLENNHLLESMPLRKALNCVLSTMHPNADELTNFENKFVNSMKARQSKDKRNPNALYMTRFHNLTRLLMYNIVQLFNNETLARTLCLPQVISQQLETICKNIKHHARQTCNGQFKTDFYTHSHYNGLFLFLDNHTIIHLRKSSKDIEIHKKVFNLDIEQSPIPDIQLKKTNFLKLLAYEILAKCSANNQQLIDGDDARRIYFRRALSGIAKLSTGQVVHRF